MSAVIKKNKSKYSALYPCGNILASVFAETKVQARKKLNVKMGHGVNQDTTKNFKVV